VKNFGGGSAEAAFRRRSFAANRQRFQSVRRAGPSFALALRVVNDQRQNTKQRWQGDFRLICDCQRHAKQHPFWRRAIRVAARGAALMVGIPLAFAALDINSVLSLNVVGIGHDELRAAQNADGRPNGALPIFTTQSVREGFLSGNVTPRSLTIDLFKEKYFRENVPYGAIIFREARRYNLAPELVAAMVHTESDFRSTLVSQKRAQGLMQIVPSTARTLGILDPFDPEQNIAAGTKYFRYLLDRFDNETIALAAYNAGEGNVERFGGIPPFRETRDYIVKVNRRTDRYRQRVHNMYLATMRVQRDEIQ
jgi:soluble lytic murein transglycosylase-like protein